MHPASLATNSRGMESSNSSTALAPPLQTPPPQFRHRHSPPRGGGGDYSTDCPLPAPSSAAIIPFSSASSGRRFMLPAGWGIQEVPRSTGASNVDRYYFEPGTGRKFRSLREVERHLNGGEYTPRSRAAFTNTTHLSRKMVVSGGKLLSVDEGDLNMGHWAVVSSANTATSRHQLPDGWVVEEVLRRDGSSVDKYYYEPETGQKFRSILAVEKHLAELGEHHMPLSESQQVLNQNRLFSNKFKQNQQHNCSKNSASSKRNMSGEVKQASPFVAPPSKIKWVLASPRGNAWSPFLAETPVPDSVKRQWNNRFMLFVNDA